jgi:hypothetical protein
MWPLAFGQDFAEIDLKPNISSSQQMIMALS